MRSKASAPLLRLPNSNAAIIDMALASPIPLNAVSCLIDSFPNSLKLLSVLAKIRLDNATALSVLVPEPIKIATSSASLKARLKRLCLYLLVSLLAGRLATSFLLKMKRLFLSSSKYKNCKFINR